MNTSFSSDHFINLKRLLALEKREDELYYKSKLEGTSFKQRRTLGVCWYPVLIENTRYDAGERLLIKVSRAREHIQSDAFQSGKLVKLFSVGKNNSEDEHFVNGVVNQAKDGEMYITLNCDELPQWTYDGNLGVQLLFDENSYREMEGVLDFLLNTSQPKIQHLKSVLLGVKEAEFSSYANTNLPTLNAQQNSALNKVLSAKDVAIIHGPPGTGKTTTLIQCILETLKTETQVLVCAPSNAAIDLILEKLNQQGVQGVRIGHPARVTEEALSFTLDARVAQHPEYKNLKAYRKQADEYFNLAGKWKRNFGSAEREQRQMLFKEARKLKQEAEHLSDYICDDIIDKCRVVASTLVGANHSKIRGKIFSTVFIDEAAQALEPACWIPIAKANRVIFAGDHCQLPPTIRSFQAAKEGLEHTLFEQLMQKQSLSVMLNEQYRMNKAIMKFSSEMFYGDELKANAHVENHLVFLNDSPVEFIDTAGCAFFEEINPESKSTFNKEEAYLLMKHLSLYLDQVTESGQMDTLKNIGIISPYRAQIEFLKEVLLSAEIQEEIKQKININTIDSFQGQERDVIYISLVRSNEAGEIGFLSEIRRLNVALTRARKKLVVIGDSATIGQHNFYEKFIDYAQKIGAYKSAFELMY